MLCSNTMPNPIRPRLEDPLSLAAGALPRLGWGLGVLTVLWAAVIWALSA